MVNLMKTKLFKSFKTTEVENKGEDESTSMEQLHVDGQSDKKTDVDEENDAKDEKKETDAHPVADLIYTDK